MAWDIYRATLLKVQIIESDASSPFALPFAVTNESSLFDATFVMFTCSGDIRNRSGGGLTNVSALGPRFGPMKIEAGTTGNTFCQLDGPESMIQSDPDDPVVAAHITVTLTYRTLGFWRYTDPVEFTWYTKGSRPLWIQGPIAP